MPSTVTTSEHAERVLAQLDGVASTGACTWKARCPAHDDRNPSLSISDAGDRVLLHCFAGCTPTAVMQAIGIPMRDLFAADTSRIRVGGAWAAPGADRPAAGALEARHDALLARRTAATLPPARRQNDERTWPEVARYPYHDAQDRLAYWTIRYEAQDGSGRKSFRPLTPDGRRTLDGVQRVPYRLPELIESVAAGCCVYWVEGEKCADALHAEGRIATTLAGGAGARWQPGFAEHVRGAHVVILPDNDAPGRQYAERIAGELHAAGAASVRLLALPGLAPDGSDVFDWLAAGGTVEALDALAADAPEWIPSTPIDTPNAPDAPDAPSDRGSDADPADTPNASNERLSWSLAELLARPDLLVPPKAVLPGVGFVGRSTLLAGREKGGKTTFAAAGAAAVSCGRPFLGTATVAGTVLWVALEEHPADVVQRLQRFGADPHRMHIAPRLPDGVGTLRTLVDTHQPVLIVVDTLAALASAIVDDFNSAAGWLPLITGLTELAHDSGAALVLLHHASKTTGRYRDSTAIGGGVDAIVELSDPEAAGDPSRRELRARGRMPMEDFGVRFDSRDFTRITAANASPLEIQVLDFVRANPGCSKNRIRSAVPGRAARIDEAVTGLAQRGVIVRDDDGFRVAVRSSTAPAAPDMDTDEVPPW